MDELRNICGLGLISTVGCIFVLVVMFLAALKYLIVGSRGR